MELSAILFSLIPTFPYFLENLSATNPNINLKIKIHLGPQLQTFESLHKKKVATRNE